MSLAVLRNLNDAGYSNLTPVQMQVIPAVLSRRDMMVCSTTGSGKSRCVIVMVITHTVIMMLHAVVVMLHVVIMIHYT